MRTFRMSLAGALVLVLLTGFGNASSVYGQSEGYEVESDVVSHQMTQDIHVWYPDSDGDFPVVYAMHGLGRNGSDWHVIGPALAEHGVVVFAPDYRSTDNEQDRWDRIVQDLVCGYRYAREIAGDYGGDLALPVTFVGHSLGSEMAIAGGLDTTDFVPDGPYDVCFTGTPGPDAIVAIAGCYYEYEGQRFPFDASQYGSGDARMVLVGGEDDEVCAAWQSRDATEVFAASGHEVTSVEIPAATHMTLIGHDVIDGEELAVPDHPAAAEVVQIILDVIAAEGAGTD